MRLKPLIAIIEEGLKNSNSLIVIPGVYRYLSKLQAKNTAEALQLVNDPSDVDKISSYIHQFVKSRLSTKKATLVDLGVGPNLTPPKLHQKIISNLKTDVLIGIDASLNVLKILEQKEAFLELTCRKKLMNKTFEELTKNPSLLFREIPSPHALFLSLGFTFSNFTKEFIASFLTKIIRKNDCIALIAPFIQDLQDGLARICGKYERDPKLLQKKKFFDCASLVEIGFDLGDLDFQFQFDSTTFENRGIAILRHISKNIPDRLIQSGLKVGQRFETILSRKFTLEMLQQEMEGLGFEVELHLVNNGKAIFALCQKIH